MGRKSKASKAMSARWRQYWEKTGRIVQTQCNSATGTPCRVAIPVHKDEVNAGVPIPFHSSADGGTIRNMPATERTCGEGLPTRRRLRTMTTLQPRPVISYRLASESSPDAENHHHISDVEDDVSFSPPTPRNVLRKHPTMRRRQSQYTSNADVYYRVWSEGVNAGHNSHSGFSAGDKVVQASACPIENDERLLSAAASRKYGRTPCKKKRKLTVQKT